MNENEAELISMRYFNMATHYVGTIAKISEAARGIKNSQSDTAVIDWLNQAFDTLAQARRQADDDMLSVLLDIKAMSTRLAKNGHKSDAKNAGGCDVK